MGWTGVHRDKGMTSKEFLTKELFSSGWAEIVESATVGDVFYAAVRSLEGEYKGQVWGLVVLMNYSRSTHDYWNFSYKEMSEEMGPYYYDAPPRVLDKLTEPLNDSAKEWREKCWENANRPKVKAGDIIEFDTPVRFTDGTEHTRFHCHSLRPSVFAALDGVMTGSLYKISKRVYQKARVVG